MTPEAHPSDERSAALLAEKTRDLDQALKQQVATADVLKIISRSGFELDTVMNTLARSAAALCDADMSSLFLKEGDRLVPHGVSEVSEEFKRFLLSTSVPLDGTSYLGRAVQDGSVFNIADYENDTVSQLRTYQQRFGFKSILIVPLIRDGGGVGAFALSRFRVGPYTQRQIDLVQTFADQAVIAIENTRLIEELKSRTDQLQRSLEELGKAQARLVQSEKLASLGTLVAGLSHEINTPLGNALTLTTAMESDVGQLARSLEAGQLLRSDLTRKVGRLGDGTRLVRTDLTRAVDLVQRFRQVASDRTGTERGLIRVKTWAETLFRSHPALSASPHRYEITCPDDLAVESYPETWSQVLAGLIENSVRHGFPDSRSGRLTLAAEAEPDGGAALVYRDDGIGIAAELLPKIFDPFFTTTRAAGASGLGLHIVHNAITAMGGQISVESEAGSGTTFRIHLPARDRGATRREGERATGSGPER